MVIVKTDNEKRFGVTVNLPGVGTQTPDANGEFEAEKEGAEWLIQYQKDFYIKSTKKVKTPVQTDDLKTDEINKQLAAEEIKEKSETDELDSEGPADETVTLAAEEKEAFIATLANKTNAEIKEDCKTFGLPGKEWRQLNKAELIEYLTSKI